MISRADIGQFLQQSDVSFIMIVSFMTSRNSMIQFLSCMKQCSFRLHHSNCTNPVIDLFKDPVKDAF